ncbi:MAG TPA: four helix bundle protein [Vicinamibacteria bacterium]|jgi:four helix bundle protein
MNGRFEAYEVALELAAALGPAMASIAHQDRDLASQLRRATSSVALCLAEGSRRNGKDRLHLYRVAAGSAAEVRAALALARAWSFSTPSQLAAPEALLDRVLAMLWRLTHPGGERRCAR